MFFNTQPVLGFRLFQHPVPLSFWSGAAPPRSPCRSLGFDECSKCAARHGLRFQLPHISGSPCARLAAGLDETAAPQSPLPSKPEQMGRPRCVRNKERLTSRAKKQDLKTKNNAFKKVVKYSDDTVVTCNVACIQQVLVGMTQAKSEVWLVEHGVLQSKKDSFHMLWSRCGASR